MNLSVKILTLFFTLMLIISIAGCKNQHNYSSDSNNTLRNSDIKSKDKKEIASIGNSNDEHSTKNEEIQRRNLKLIWKSENKISHYANPVINDEDIFVGSKGFTCLDRKTGKLKWSQEKAYFGFVKSMYYNNEMISYVDLGEIYVLKRSNGEILYQNSIKKEVNCTTIIVNGVLYYLERGCLNALDLKTQKVIWFYIPENSVPASFDSNMVLYNNFIIYETLGRIIAVDLDTRETKWDTGKIGADDAPIILWDNNACILSREGKICAINADDGRIKWETELQYDKKKYYSIVYSNHLSYSNTQVKDGRLFFTASNGHIYGVDLLNGEIILDFLFKGEETYAKTDIAIHNNRLFYINNSNIYSVDLSGNDITVYDTGIQVGERLVIQNEEFFIMDIDDNLYKYKLIE